MNCYWMLLYLCVSSKKNTHLFSQYNETNLMGNDPLASEDRFILLMVFRTWASKSQKIDQNHKKSSNIFEHSRKYLTRLWFPRCAGCEKTASHSPHCRSNWAHWSAACCRNDFRKEKPSLVNLIDNRLSTKTKRQTY